MKVPEIDQRSYEDIVTRTQALVEDFTSVVNGWQPPGASEVEPSYTELVGRILNQEISDPVTGETIARGTLIDTNLAQKITKLIQPGARVKVKALPGSIIGVKATAANLMGHILNQDITDPVTGKMIARGKLIDATLAEQISQIQANKHVKVIVRNDAGSALIGIFSHMVDLAIKRLNKVPEKNFLAFLDLIGTQLQSPQPAQVPLTFHLAPGSPTDALVPALTQVAAPPAEGETEEIIFETDSDLVVTTAQLISVFVRDPIADQYGDYTEVVKELGDKSFAAFSGNRLIDHSLYLACDRFFTLPVSKTVTLTIHSPDAARLAAMPIKWYYWDSSNTIKSLTVKLTSDHEQLQVSIEDFPIPTIQTINNSKAAWLEARLEGPLLKNESPPTIDQITVKVNVKQSDLAPDLAFTNTLPLDITKDFNPFGTQPAFNDTLYLASQEAFSRPNSAITINVKLSESPPLPINPSPDLEIDWEVWNGRVWQSVGKSVPQTSQSHSDFIDTTQAFTKNGTIQFKLPLEITSSKVNGQTSYWVRARIVKGNYGINVGSSQLSTITTLSENSQDTDPNEKKIIKVSSCRGFLPGDRILIVSSSDNQEEREIESINLTENKFTLREALTQNHQIGTSIILRNNSSSGPPSVASLSLSYDYEQSSSVSACQSYNDFTYVDLTAQAAHPDGSSFKPFVPTTDQEPSLYLGFDQRFSSQLITLYVGLEPIYHHTPESGDMTKDPGRIIWEYSSELDNKSVWKPLDVQDQTHGFTERGLIQFIGSTDFIKTVEFGQNLYWLRARWQKGKSSVPPSLKRLLLNTTWGTQATTIKNEILGSSNDQTNQVFRTIKAPALEKPQLEVLEPLMPLVPEPKGENVSTPNLDATGQIQGYWIPWREVPNFYASDTSDRHYVLDHLTGKVYFGDDRRGMVPPQGRNNIRMTYRTGGGQRGNLPAGKIIQIKTTVPYIDRVTNYEPAGAGADAETLEAVKQRGPKALRHRGRAVTAQDFEDLALEASPAVAQAKAIAPQNVNGAGSVGLIIVPRSNDPQPTPSLDLLEKVEKYIRDRCAPTLELQTSQPDWVEIKVTAEVVPISLPMASNLKVTVMKALQSFLHPLTGGWDKQGWSFGRKPHKSDFYKLLEFIDGVDYIATMSVEENPNSDQQAPERFLVFSGSHNITIKQPSDQK